jgi:SAM-dependent methyltransferase
MNFLDLRNISERFMKLVNPTTAEKILTIGRVLGLRKRSRVIDFGCGFGEVLALWAEHFGISAIGIDIREYACNRAKQRMTERKLTERITIVQANAANYPFEEHAFDVAACIGASFIWGGYKPTIHRLKEAIHNHGKLVIGEPYWLTQHVPYEYVRQEQTVHTEQELLRITREEGFDFEYVVRASHDDWDRYEADNWHGLIQWIEENSDHPDRQEVIDYLHRCQDEYLKYGREYLGWALYILNPRHY